MLNLFVHVVKFRGYSCCMDRYFSNVIIKWPYFSQLFQITLNEDSIASLKVNSKEANNIKKVRSIIGMRYQWLTYMP